MKTTDKFPLTIAPELFEAWKKATRKKDTQKIATVLNISRPLITRALVYGHVTKDGLVDQINLFFKTRLEAEKDTASELNAMTSGKKSK